jgi:arylsulfatase A-like enzyme
MPDFTDRRLIMTRIVSLTLAGLTALVLMLGGLAGCGSVRGEEIKPNIIFIMADDLGYGDLGSYGQTVIQTPHLDRLAEDGVRFTQVYAGSPVCAPARSVLMTGQHTGHTRVRGNMSRVGGVPPQGRVPLEPEDVTVAEVLKRAGYVTGITGKWGLGEPDTHGIPTRKGFDEWFGYLNQRNAHSYYPPYLWHNEEQVVLKGNLEGRREQYSHDLFTDFALQFIRQHRDEPFFLYLPYTVPHAEYEIPSTEPYSDEPWTDDEKVHAAMVTLLDRDVGRIVALISELGIENRTIVFFCSDNGAAERWEGRFDSSGSLRGRKRDVYEGGIRTPMIVRYPGVITPGRVDDRVWYFADVLPTLAAIAGVEAPEGIDGVNVLPTLIGEEQDLSDRFLYWEFHEGNFLQAVRWGDWKAVRPGVGAPLELFDLANDPAETRDVAADTPEVVAHFEAYLRDARTDSPLWPVEPVGARR